MLSRSSINNSSAFTLIELVITVLLSSIVMLGLGVMMYDNQRGWNQMYNRIYSDIVTDGLVAHKSFDAVVRKSSKNNFNIDPAGQWVELAYYSDTSVSSIDRYARFYKSGSELFIEEGTLNPRASTDTRKISSNVSKCRFLNSGVSVQLIMTLDDGSIKVDVLSTGVMHN